MEARASARFALESARSGRGGAAASLPQRTPAAAAISGSDTASESASDSGESDLSSLDGFGDYARGLQLEDERRSSPRGPTSTAGSSAAPPARDPDSLPSPRALLAPLGHCTPRASAMTARDSERADEDLQLLLRSAELPGSRHRIARMLVHADGLGADALAGEPRAAAVGCLC